MLCPHIVSTHQSLSPHTAFCQLQHTRAMVLGRRMPFGGDLYASLHRHTQITQMQSRQSHTFFFLFLNNSDLENKSKIKNNPTSTLWPVSDSFFAWLVLSLATSHLYALSYSCTSIKQWPRICLQWSHDVWHGAVRLTIKAFFKLCATLPVIQPQLICRYQMWNI